MPIIRLNKSKRLLVDNYYNENATSFFNDTVNVDMRSLYNKFLPLVKEGGSILDAGLW